MAMGEPDVPGPPAAPLYAPEVVADYVARAKRAGAALVVLGAAVTAVSFALGPTLDYTLSWPLFFAGFGGWYVALVLRAPLFLALKTFVDESHHAKVIIALSGPCEEAVRAVLVWAVLPAAGFTSEPARSSLVSIGVGWGVVEILFTMIQALAMCKLAQDETEKGREALLQLEQVTGRKLGEDEPLWGVLERLSALFVHLSFTLFLAHHWWPAVLLAGVHSALNFAIFTQQKVRGIAATELAFLVFSIISLVISVIQL